MKTNEWDVQLSEDFFLSEFMLSDTATKLGINNTMGIQTFNVLADFVEHILQPLRNKLGRSITISSGFRNDQLNKAVGGTPPSQHRLGEASDLVSGDAKELFEFIQNSGLEFDQLILYTKQNFVHISYKKGKNRKQVIINN